jgi:hypothetical protein
MILRNSSFKGVRYYFQATKTLTTSIISITTECTTQLAPDSGGGVGESPLVPVDTLPEEVGLLEVALPLEVGFPLVLASVGLVSSVGPLEELVEPPEHCATGGFCMLLLDPQHANVPSSLMPQVQESPATSLVKVSPAGGVLAADCWFHPQHCAWLSLYRMPQVWCAPTATEEKVTPEGGVSCPS